MNHEQRSAASDFEGWEATLLKALQKNLKGGGLQRWFIFAVTFKNKGFVARWEAQPSHLDRPAPLPSQCAGSTSGADRSMAPSPIDAGSSGSGQIDQAGDRLREVLIWLLTTV